jgi:putative transposase
LQTKAKEELQQIWMASSQAGSAISLDAFIQTYEAEYPQAVACLAKDRGVLYPYLVHPAS